MGMFMKTLRMTVSVFSLILASVAPSSAQATVFVNGNTTFTVTWSGSVEGGATLLAQATFTVSNWTGTSFVMTVTNVKNTMPTSPNINARLTAFGFGLTPEGTFSNLVNWKHLPMGVHEFPGVSTRRCVFDERWRLRRRREWRSQSRSSIARDLLCHDYRRLHEWGHDHADSCEISNRLGSLETDGVVIDPPPSGASDLTITKTHTPSIAIPGETVTYTVTVSNVGSCAVERRGDRDRDAAAGPDGYGALRHRLDLHRRNTDLHSKRRARPGGELPTDYGGDECRRRCGAWDGDEHRRRFRRRRLELDQ